MAVNIHNLIAAISPDIYCDPSVKEEVKRIVKKDGYLKAAEKAKPRESGFVDFDEIALKNPFSSPGLKDPREVHKLVYDSFGESLEPLYFWILDTLMENYGKVDKLTDNFISSPGSAHFAEMGGRATRMQEEAMKILGTANQIVRSVLNIIYDLKEFDIRLGAYHDIHDKDDKKRKAALLSLKQIWLDTVDVKRNTSSIKGFVQQFEYVTLIDAFMAANSLEEVEKLDLNDRVKKILEQRIPEFLRWVDESEKELRKRYQVEKIYLKSQVNAIRLYARWVKPYLQAAAKLEQNARSTAALVTSFNTTLFELALLGEGKYDPDDDVKKGDLPTMVKNTEKRVYSPIVIVEINFRSVPERASQQGGYGFRGRLEAEFTSYALNDQELKVLREEIGKDDVGEVLKFIQGATDESLAQIEEDINKYTNEKKDDKKEDKEDKDDEDVNPFTSLFAFKDKKDDKKEDLSKGIKPDSTIEKAVRSQAIIEARKGCRRLYDGYKKAHSMPAFPG
ncbi:hypothetical protein KW805_00405 [Candidatus Pacearchaeota archaeon]|nr:hypothetical protein [Candidatus Pacearchaeota archaeon]